MMYPQARYAKNLPAIIRKRISSEGMITFRDFMDTALYHSSLGYYMTSKGKIGREGDYYTSPDVHRVFGISLMKQLAEMREIMGSRKTFHIVEAGAGKGSLCADILISARERVPALFAAARYTIVEKSPALTEAQRQTVVSAGLCGKVEWADSLGSALKRRKSAVIFSNELLDAFPVHRVTFDGNEWREIFVAINEGEFEEVLAPLSSSELEGFLSGLEGPFNDGYTTEVNLDAMEWIRGVGGNLKRGFVVSIDYGYPKADYYSPLRSDGTLLCYHRHEVCDKPYIRIGEQDITAHVDFTSLAEAGFESGLDVTGFCEQFHFLMGTGIFDELQDAGVHTSLERKDSGGFPGEIDLRSFKDNLAIKRLLMPDSMGGTFKILIQHKGIDKPDLMAFSFKDLSHRL